MESARELMNTEVLWGVVLWRLVLGSLLIFTGLAARKVIQALFRGWLTRQAKRTDVKWDDELVERAPAPLGVIAQVGLWFVAAQLFSLPTEPMAVRTWVMQGLELATWVGVTWLAFRLVDVMSATMARAAEKTESKLDDQLIPLVRRTLKLVLGITVAIMLIQNLGYSVTSLIASLGVGGLALALAAKDTVANLFGSVVIFTDRPFQIGDWVQFGDVEGTVEEVGFRTTRIRRFDKSEVTVPNSQFSSEAITNHSRRNLRRINMTVGVTYETSAGQMRSLLEALRILVAEHTGLDRSFSFVHMVGFGGSSLDIQIYCFTESTVWTEFLEVREKLMLAIMETVAAQGLEMAFPTQTVYLRDEKWPERLAS